MLSKIATIRIANLRLRTYIGFNADERSKQQDIVVNATIRHRLQPAAVSDTVSAALDYKIITKAIIEHVETGRFLLLERLTHDLLEICTRDAAVLHASVSVDKPHALRFADSVSVTLDYDHQHATQASDNHEYDRFPISQAS